VDYLDPGAAYYQFTFMLTLATQDTLLGWKPNDQAGPSPLLAVKPPSMGAGGKAIRLHIHSGVHYSPPLGGGVAIDRAVRSSDVKYAFERGLLPGVGNAYESVYLAHLIGFRRAEQQAAAQPTKAPDIAGITTPTKTTVIFKFHKPVTPAQIQALSLPVSAPVPRAYAAQYDAQTPSTYGLHQVTTGPYYISEYLPGKEILLSRNPNWTPKGDFRPAYLDEIRVQEGFADTTSAGQKILAGSGAVNGDFSAEPAILKLAATNYPSQLALTPTGGTEYAVLNTSRPPFNDLNVRRAVVAVTDRVALRQTRGGALAGAIAEHFIPPGIPGYQQAGGAHPPPGLNFMNYPHGNLNLAEKYMRRAGYPTGRCQENCGVTMIGDEAGIDQNEAQVVKVDLSQLGFNVELDTVARDVMYSKFCNVPSNEPNVCPNLGWLKDFTDPQSALNVAFDGRHIKPSNNYNWSLLDVGRINHALQKAALITDQAKRAAAYGSIDRAITAQAPAIPWIWLNEANIESGNVDGVINRFNAFSSVAP